MLIEEVADKIYKILLPMPFKLDHINLYLIRENNSLALIDTGMATPESWAALKAAMVALNLKFSEISDIFVTHAHPDHIGQLNLLRKLAPEARLHIHRRELKNIQAQINDPEETERRIHDWFLSNGATNLEMEMAMPIQYPVIEIKPEDHHLQGGEKIALGDQPDGSWEILWTPGHTAGHFVVYSQARQILLSGDHLLAQINSNVGKYPGSTADPLGDYLNSLKKIAELELHQIFPAHGPSFSDYHARIAKLTEHHHHRQNRMYNAFGNKPATAADIVKVIWGDRLEGFDRFLALIETLSHLERLVRENRVIPERHNGVVYYRTA